MKVSRLIFGSVFLTAMACAAEPESTRGLENLDFRQVVKDAKAKVFPAVVFIKCVRQDMQRGEKLSQEVSGSGVLISADGEIVSNWHVVDKATEVRCLLFDGGAYSAKVLGSDKDTDVALLKLTTPLGLPPGSSNQAPASGLPFARFGDATKLTEGDFVMAMGAPFGLSRSVSIGIISCTRRYLPGASEYSIWLQTDASINPGNSGGPLVNTSGEVVGLNTRGMMGGGGDMGFTVPVDVVRAVADQIRKNGKMEWSWTGLQLQPLKDFGRNIYFQGDQGVIVAETDVESPARRAGILVNDRLLKMNGEPLNGVTQEDLPGLRRRLGLLPKGVAASIELTRGGTNLVVQVTPREKGKVEGEELECPRWDLTVKAINQFDNPDLYFQQKQGVFIYGVKSPGNAYSAGLTSQDILMKVDGHEVKTLADVKDIHSKALENVSAKHKIRVDVLRNGELRQIMLDFGLQTDKE